MSGEAIFIEGEKMTENDENLDFVEEKKKRTAVWRVCLSLIFRDSMASWQ
jgi:hypothetical protein